MANIFTLTLLYKLIAVFIASMAFAVILRINRRHILLSGVGAAITFLIYSISIGLINSFFGAAFISTFIATLYAEILARVRRAPTIVYTLTAVIPTVPGGDLYHAMRYLLMNDTEAAIYHFSVTAEIGLGIAGGIVAMSIIFATAMDTYRKLKERMPKNAEK